MPLIATHVECLVIFSQQQQQKQQQQTEVI